MSSITLRLWSISAASLAVAFVIAFVSSCFGQSKSSTARIRQCDHMIDAMASRNKAPKIVRTSDNYQALALFSPDFDWSDQERVQKAVKAAREDKSDEMWWELRKHIGDNRYALTVDFDVSTEIWNLSVGDFCSSITEADLKEAYARHLPKVSGEMPFIFSILDEKNMKKWKDRPLYQLQVEVCEEAVRQIASIKATSDLHGGDYKSPSHTLTAQEKARFTEAVKKQIEELKRTKKAVTAANISIHGFGFRGFDRFDAKGAKWMREAYEKDKHEKEAAPKK